MFKRDTGLTLTLVILSEIGVVTFGSVNVHPLSLFADEVVSILAAFGRSAAVLELTPATTTHPSVDSFPNFGTNITHQQLTSERLATWSRPYA